MSDVTTLDFGAFESPRTKERVKPAPKTSWPLMGDVLASRGGVPEHLIQWRRAMGENDPEPLL